MHRKKSLKEIDKMSPHERWQLACDKLSNSKNTGVVSTLLEHMRAHENTHWLVYESHVSDQVPRSYAAHAFVELQKSVLHYEIMRLCTFWDPVDLDSRSIPTITALADCSGVSKHVYDDHFSHYENYDPAYARKWGARARQRLRRGIRVTTEVEGSETLRHVKNYRDKLAHQLEQTREEKRGAVPMARYGDERRLLRKTMTVVNNLYLSLNGTGFDWDGSRKMHERNAEAFWKGMEIKILR